MVDWLGLGSICAVWNGLTMSCVELISFWRCFVVLVYTLVACVNSFALIVGYNARRTRLNTMGGGRAIAPSCERGQVQQHIVPMFIAPVFYLLFVFSSDFGDGGWSDGAPGSGDFGGHRKRNRNRLRGEQPVSEERRRRIFLEFSLRQSNQ